MELSAQSELAPAWRAIRAELRSVVGESTYELWLADLEPCGWDGTVLSLQAPADTAPWISRRFNRVLQRSVQAALGSRARAELAPTASSASTRASAPAERSPPPPPTLNPRYSFDQFVIGEGNRLAHAAALAIAELPGQAYNPLFLHAASGLGKTHLLHAIGNYLLAFGDRPAVRYTTAEAFTNHFVGALSSRSINLFKETYRDADVLLIDDVQFLASKAKTEEEFFHTFNALYETGRQLVVSCDRLPRQLVAIEERLRERFEAGLVANISPPDFATRVAILRKRVALDYIQLADDQVLSQIAGRITNNIRALEGALIRVVAHHSLSGKPIDVELTATVLDGIAPLSPSAPSIASIQHTVAERYGVSVAELLSTARTAKVAWARHVALHLARELTDTPLSMLGKEFGGRNHATVLHACKRVAERVGSDRDAATDVHELAAALTSEQPDRAC